MNTLWGEAFVVAVLVGMVRVFTLYLVPLGHAPVKGSRHVEVDDHLDERQQQNTRQHHEIRLLQRHNEDLQQPAMFQRCSVTHNSFQRKQPYDVRRQLRDWSSGIVPRCGHKAART